MYADYAGTAIPEAPRRATVGWIALVVGAASMIGSVAAALVHYTRFDPSQVPAGEDVAQAGLAAAVLEALLVWFLLGVWAVVQGIVALATKRGVGPAIIALLLGLMGPWSGIALAAVLYTQAYPSI